MSIPLPRLEAISLLARLNHDIFAAKTADVRTQSYSAPQDVLTYTAKTQVLADKVEALIKADETP